MGRIEKILIKLFTHQKKIILIIASVLIHIVILYGKNISSAEPGLPFIRNYSPKEYGFHPQNWVITQDARGIIFIANTAGLLEYDGVTWRQHELFDNLTVVSLAIAPNGTLFVGGRGDFGFLQPDSSGRLIYHSLLEYLPQKKRNIRMVWETIATTHGVYFRTKYHIFKWNGKEVVSWQSNTAFRHISAVRDTLYIVEKDNGLLTISGDSLSVLPDGHKLSDATVNAILPFDNVSKTLIATRNMGLFLYDGHRLRPFKTRVDAFFRDNQLYHGIPLSGREPRFALATTQGGVVIINQKGEVKQHLNKSLGLADDKIHYLFEDRAGALWLSLNNGLSRVELTTPFRIFDQRLGIEGTPHVFKVHRNIFYAGTNRGLYRLSSKSVVSGSATPEPFSAGRIFLPVAGIIEQVWALHSDDEQLLVGTGRGIFSVRGATTQLVASLPVATYCFYRSENNNLLFAGTRYGLVILERNEGAWRPIGKVEGVSEAIRTIKSDIDGNLWLGTAFQGLIKIEINNDYPLRSKVRKFGRAYGLPGGMNYVYSVNKGLRIGTYHGLYRYHSQRQIFIPDSSLGEFLADSSLSINFLTEDHKSGLWLMAGTRNSALLHGIPQGKTYLWQDKPFLRLLDMNALLDIYPQKNGDIWLVGRDEKIYRYDTDPASPDTIPFQVMVRKITTIPGDSLIWGGSPAAGQNSDNKGALLRFTDNSLRFEYAATGFEEASANRYKIKLEGYDKNEHPWTSETRKDYTGLPAGSYVFKVRAKNIYGDISREDRFYIRIAAPWYQSLWAYLLYALFLFSLIALVVKLRLRRLEQKNRRLEKIIAQRTQLIAEQADKLKSLNTMKSQFFANISHEFRTPLTLILGPLEDMLVKKKEDADKVALLLMRRNARRILQLINQLLDLARLESGRLKLQAAEGNLTEFVKGIVMSFASLAAQKQIELKYSIEESPLLEKACFDRDVVEKIFYNLLSNAFKFTGSDGIVEVSVSDRNQNGLAEIIIKDSGTGIPDNRLDTIFERFYQVGDANARRQEGTGIGLALTRELVELHHGRITVASESGKGSEFIVTLCVAKASFSANEISEKEASEPETFPLHTGPDVVKMEGKIKKKASIDSDIPIILVVDDHDEVRNYISGHLAGIYTVLEATNGRDGLNIATETIPDMVISDVMMPELNGYQLCEALKLNEKTSHIPVILLTAKAGEKDKLSGLENGADDYLTKPFNSKELHIRVRNLITSRRKLQKRFQREGMLIPRQDKIPSVEEVFLLRLMDVLEDNLGDENFSVESLSASMAMGRRQLHRKIKALTGVSPSDFIRTVRLQRAKQFLEAKSGTVSEIAFRTGFGSLSYFTTVFKRQFGLLPSEI